MGGGIFILRDDGEFVELIEEPYASEKLLQGYLAKYPNLLAGDQIDSANPRRWLLVSREFHVSSDESDVGWLDHLFLDQDGVPTLIEVKRSSNTRIRREIVGQLLDYAANAVLHMPVETIRSRFEMRCEREQRNVDEDLQELLGPEGEPETFWTQVQDNLRVGRVRLVFVADVIPVELRRIVEFLNVQMNPAEVLAVEIRQYMGEGICSLVPRVIGQIASPPKPEQRQWDEKSYFAELLRKFRPAEVEVARQILSWVSSRVTEICWGKGLKHGSFYPVCRWNDLYFRLFVVYSNGYIETSFQHYQGVPPFHSDEKRLELLARLNAIPSISWPEDVIARRPSIPFSALTNEGALQQFFAAFEWMISEIQSSAPMPE